MYSFRGIKTKPHLIAALNRYIAKGHHPGGFLEAVICNDLRGAVANADDECIRQIPAYVGYLYNEAPLGCWGSEESMTRWMHARMEKDHETLSSV